ncbi:MAG TPA: hypothetical protein VMZ53_00080 [Kofleriaceae bacterium]|nr:hypothetical protein [Kofleriaceae bacterium]
MLLLACSGKRDKPRADIDDAGGGSTILQHGDPELSRKPEEAVKAVDALVWSIGISQPLMLLEHTPTANQPPFCQDGKALLNKLFDDIKADTASQCTPSMSAQTDELAIQCRLNIAGECTYFYRATLWTEWDRAIDHKYRLLGTAWLQESFCGDARKRADADPNLLFRVQIGKSFRALVDQCRSSGTSP